MSKLLQLDTFIERAKLIHGDLYNYSKFKYTGANKKSVVICPKHGEFEKSPSKHISTKQGCPKCSNELKG